MLAIKNILVATDFGEPSFVAMTYGRDLARQYHARLHVLHVVEDVLLRLSPEIAYSAVEIQKGLDANAHRLLNAEITEDDRRNLNVVPVVQTAVNIPDAIVRYAADNAIDLVLVGTHGRGAIKHLLLGSVAERVVRLAPCPVLTVRQHERDFVVDDASRVAGS